MANRLYGHVILASLLVLALSAAQANAQSATTGTVAGIVTFAANGDPVHGATVIVLNARRQTTTGEDGKFRIEDVPAGTYEVIAQRAQLATVRQTVTVAPSQTVTLDFKLSVGSAENLTVTASATGATTTFDSFNSVTTIDSTAIAKKIGPTLADVLQNEPGIAKRTFGPGTSRPIIRGFDGDRVLVMQDGIRTGDLSSQSGDHGVSIDPGGLSRIEVVKGPATLLYGSNAIGGVVNAITPQDAFRTAPFTGMLSGLSFDAGSANAQSGLVANIQRGTGPFLLFGSLTARRTGDYDAPDLTIPNSATRLVTGEGGMGWNGRRAFFGASVGIERNRYGIPFAGLLEGDEDSQIDLVVRRENVRFDAGMKNLGGQFADAIKFTGSFINYQHDELEIADGEESLGTRFNNQIFTARAEVEQQPGHKITGRLGMDFLTRDYESIGAEALAPATTQQSLAAFAYEEMAIGKHRLMFGGRAEHVGYDAAFESGPVNRTFDAFSGSIGAHASLGSSAALVLNVTGASRAPALEELFNFGPHPGNLAFEVGNPDLLIERTLGFDVSFRARHEDARFEINVFNYNISNFVFLDVTDEIEDGLHLSYYVQGDSRFTGADGAGHFHVGERLELTAGLSYVRAKLTATNESLPRIPPLQGRLELAIKLRDFSISPELVLSAAQHNVFRSESTTASWATGNIAVTWQRSQAHRTHLIAFQAFNLANTTYSLHTSFLKELAPEIGRGAKISYSVRFF